jgi:hypothetical protein
MQSKWLDWTPSFDGSVGSVSEENPIIRAVEPRIIKEAPGEEPSKPTKPSFDGFVGSVSEETSIIRAKPQIIENAAVQEPTKPTKPPASKGARDLQPSRRARESFQGALPYEKKENEKRVTDPYQELVRATLTKASDQRILEVQRSRTAMCSPDCYEVEPGRWIHHPWNGRTTIQIQCEVT